MASTCTSCGGELGEGRSVCAACGHLNAVPSAAPPGPAGAPAPTGGPLRPQDPGQHAGSQGGWVAQPPPTEPRSNALKLAALVVAVVIIAGGIFLVTRDGGSSEDTASGGAIPGMAPSTTTTSVTAVPATGGVPVDFGGGVAFTMASEPQRSEVRADSAVGAPVTGQAWYADVPGTGDREFVIVYEVDSDPLDLPAEVRRAALDNGAAVMGRVGEATYSSLDGPIVTGTIYETGVEGYVRTMAFRLPGRVIVFGYIAEGEDIAGVQQGFESFARTVSSGA